MERKAPDYADRNARHEAAMFAVFNEWRETRLSSREGLEASSSKLFQDYVEYVGAQGRTPVGRPRWGTWMGQFYAKRRAYLYRDLVTVYGGVGFKNQPPERVIVAMRPHDDSEDI